ncbi:hypothetical protein [Runella limosa]|uniref:hypothetical protein n=1 Tax=Runella limosa TaxID=370978 RepID=UPI0004169727|nr:hypothetical protein [Runella limosa]
MAKIGFKGSFENEVASYKVSLFLFHFVENQLHFVYSPHLDITGYGNTLKEAKESFEICFVEFLDYTTKKGTLGSELKKMGWTFKETSKRPKTPVAPSLSSLLKSNKYMSEILDKYPVKTFKQNFGIPAYA